MSTFTAASQRQFLVSLTFDDGTTWPGYWAKKTGGQSNMNTEEVWPGGEHTPIILSDPTKVDPIVLTREFDPDRDIVPLKRLEKTRRTVRATVTQQPTDSNLVKVGDPFVWADCAITKLSGGPDVDSGAFTAAEVMIELTPRRSA